MTKVFLSYRRGIDNNSAGRLHDRLESHFEKDHLFMDVDAIDYGEDFVSILEDAVAKCNAFLVVIGKGWLESTDRLRSEGDFVRIEIEQALARRELRVVPVLVDDAELPTQDELPLSLQPLLRRNAFRMNHGSFAQSVDSFAENIRRTIEKGEMGLLPDNRSISALEMASSVEEVGAVIELDGDSGVDKAAADGEPVTSNVADPLEIRELTETAQLDPVTSHPVRTKERELLVKVRGLKIEGRSGEDWNQIVNGVDLDLHKGEVLGLIGESGAGKSTIGLAAMGFTRDGCRISDGSVEFDGIDLVNASADVKRGLLGKRIAYVAQSAAASFNPAHKLIDQHTESPVLHGVSSQADAQRDGIELFERLRLPDPEHIGFRYPHQVSGGQLQRAMTAMAMSCRPDLIIFDEPTTALDVTTQIEVLAAIRDIVEQFNTAAIYITHDLAVVAQMADHIKVLLKGDEVEEADTRTMLSSPKEDYTKSLWAVRSFQRDQMPPVPEGTTPVVSVKNVTAAYGGAVKVLHNVSFDIHAGRTVAVVGESGSGKSTTARCITGLLPPMEGEIQFNGEALPADYRSRSKEQLRQAQMIYQMADTALNPKLKIKDLIGRPVEFYMGLKGAALKTRVEELLDQIELEPSQYYNRLPGELSGGQKQRIGIARALAAEPQFIICDEVTSALDQLVAEGILRLLDKLQKDLNLAYMFITHDLATVRSIADEVVVMKEGKVVEQGPKDVMFTPPHHSYTDLLLSSVPEMDPDWLTQLLEARGVDNIGEAASSKI